MRLESNGLLSRWSLDWSLGNRPGGGTGLPAVAVLAILAAACSTSGRASGTPTASSRLLQAGLRAQATGGVAQARRDFQLAVGKDSKNYVALYDLGVVDQETAQAQAAITEYQRALAIFPDYKSALFNLAILETSRDPRDAVRLYERLLAINPNDPNVNFNLALLQIQQGNNTAGQSHLTIALRLDPKLRSRLPPPP